MAPLSLSSTNSGGKSPFDSPRTPAEPEPEGFDEAKWVEVTQTRFHFTTEPAAFGSMVLGVFDKAISSLRVCISVYYLVVPDSVLYQFFCYVFSLCSLLAYELDDVLSVLQGITTVERQVMTGLFWPKEPVLPSIHPSEDWVIALRSRIQDAMIQAAQPLEVCRVVVL